MIFVLKGEMKVEEPDPGGPCGCPLYHCSKTRTNTNTLQMPQYSMKLKYKCVYVSLCVCVCREGRSVSVSGHDDIEPGPVYGAIL